MNKPPIRESMQARTSIDSLNPKRPKRSLAITTVAISVLETFFYRLLSGSDGIFASPLIAFCRLQHLFMARMLGYAAFDS